MDYKKRVSDALSRYYEKLEPQAEKPKRTNSKPEKQVEAEVLLWCKQLGFDVDVVEAKAVFSVATKRYTGKTTSFGLSDIVGNSSTGLAVYIELKAPGRRVGSAIRPKQREFIIRKIKTGCFAIVTDSAEYANKVWLKFQPLDYEQRVELLLSELPTHNQRQLNF